MTRTQTVDTVENNGLGDVTALVTVYAGDLLEDFTDGVDLTDGENVVRDVQVRTLYVDELTDDYSVLRLEGVTRSR